MTCACAGASSFGSMSVFRNGAKLGVAFRDPDELFFDKVRAQEEMAAGELSWQPKENSTEWE